MTRRHFRQVHVRGQANLLHLGRLLRRDGVIQILGDGVWIDLSARSTRRRRGQPPRSRHLLDPLDQLLGRVALGDLLPNQLGLGRLEGIVQIG